MVSFQIAATPEVPGADDAQVTLPQRWSDTDQLIFESLLLAAPVSKRTTKVTTHPRNKGGKPPKTTTTTATKKRKRRALSSDTRKFQHREVQRRFMERKKEAAVRTKKAAAALETQLRLLELTSESQTLEQENARLCRVFRDPPSERPSLEQLKVHLEAEKKVVERCFTPVSAAHWRGLVTLVLSEVDAYAQEATDPSVVQSVLGFRVLGWSDRRQLDGASVKFTFSKFFPHIRAHELLDETWDKVATETYASFFSPALYVTVHLLQRVSDDAMIVYRAICDPGTGRVSRSVELIGRLRRERGDFVLFIRSFDGALDVQRSVGEPASWSRTLTILRFEPASPTDARQGCTVHSGGVYSNLVTGGVQHWLMEVLFLVLRFESAMIAPIFTLYSSDTSDTVDVLPVP